jgi:magnesium chelatase family protein
MASIINSFAISGIEGYLVEIETDTIYGQPSISIIGLGDRAIKEASERIQAAIIHEGYEFPKMKIVINLAPGDIKKKGSNFDLGMAIGLLMRSAQFEPKDVDLNNFAFISSVITTRAWVHCCNKYKVSWINICAIHSRYCNLFIFHRLS